MAPLPPDGTPRFKFNYTTVHKSHTLDVRSHASPAAIGAILNDFWTALAGAIRATVLDSVEFAPTGSSIFNPVVTGFEGAAYGTGAGDDSETAWTYGWVGRTSGGRRARIFVFGAGNQGHDYRFGRGESTALDAATDVLVAAGTSLRGIDDIVPVWHNYINANTNRHWVKKLRP
jgi:hypothetical protein